MMKIIYKNKRLIESRTQEGYKEETRYSKQEEENEGRKKG